MGKKPLTVSCAVGSHFAGGKVNGAHGCPVIPIPCLGSLCLLFVFTQGKKKEKKKWVHKLQMGLFVLLPVAMYSSDITLTVLEEIRRKGKTARAHGGIRHQELTGGFGGPGAGRAFWCFPAELGSTL